MSVPVVFDDTRESVVAVEEVEQLVEVEPGAVHVQEVDGARVHDVDEAGSMVAVRVRKDQVVDVTRAVVGREVADHAVAGIGVAAVDHSDAELAVGEPVAHADRITMALAHRHEVDLVVHAHLLDGAKEAEASPIRSAEGEAPDKAKALIAGHPRNK